MILGGEIRHFHGIITGPSPENEQNTTFFLLARNERKIVFGVKYITLKIVQTYVKHTFNIVRNVCGKKREEKEGRQCKIREKYKIFLEKCQNICICQKKVVNLQRQIKRKSQ